MSNYGEWTLPELRIELTKRKARKSGRKQELVKRLEDYDRNQDFGHASSLDDSHSFSMSTPGASSYRDINANTQLPKVTLKDIEGYLSSFETALDAKAVNLYRERFILSIRAALNDRKYYISARCAAEMKKAVIYKIDILLDEKSVICECQCECAVGMGPDAHCKHVQCILYALVCFSDTQSIKIQETCTQRLQTFNKCKRFKGSPLKASAMQLRNQKSHNTTLRLAEYDPRPANRIHIDAYQSFFHNVCISFPATHSSAATTLPMPILQTIPPANIYALSNDHDYLSKHPEEVFLELLKVTKISSEERDHIEKITRGQSLNRTWREARTTRLHSSNFGRICKATEKTDFNKLAQSFLRTDSFQSASLTHGRKYESVAARKYEELSSVKTADCGIYVCIDHPFLGCSPDRIVYCINPSSFLVEIKCPYVSRENEITPVTIPYLKAYGDQITLDKCHSYYYQVQGQLLCTNTTFCDFVVYTFRDVKVYRIQRDEEFITAMITKLKTFFNDYFRKALLEQNFYKNTDKYIFDY